MPKNQNDNAQQKQTTVQRIEKLIEPAISELGLSIWDIRFEKEGPDYFLRIFIDREEPIDMKACEDATRAINPIIDQADPISQSYYMEVGSPGLGRKLVKQHHFDVMKDKKVLVRFIRPLEDGEKEIIGLLVKKEGKVLIVNVQDKQREINMANVSYVKLYDDEYLQGQDD